MCIHVFQSNYDFFRYVSCLIYHFNQFHIYQETWHFRIHRNCIISAAGLGQTLTNGPRDAALADRDQMALPGAPAQPALGDAGEKRNEVKRRETPQTLQWTCFFVVIFVSHDNYGQSVHRLNSESYTIIHILAIESCVVFLCFISGCFHCELTPWFSLVRFLPFLIVHHFDVPCPFISKCY